MRRVHSEGTRPSARSAAVPAEFWEDPRMRDALERWHIGAVIYAYRNHPFHVRVLRQETVAEWVGITQAQLSRVENGPAIKDLDKLIQWARALGIPAHLLWFQLPEQRHTHPSVAWGSHAAVCAPPVPLPAAGLFFLVRASSRASQVDGSADMAAMHTFRSADRQVGGGHLYGTVVGYLHGDVAPRLFGGDHGVEGKAVFTAAAALTELAGWMAHDAGRHDQARGHFGRALDMSRVGRDRQLSAHVLTSMSHLAYHTLRPHDGIRFARAGEDTLSGGPRNPAVEARFFAMQARGFAALRKLSETVALLGRAEQALGHSYDEEPSEWANNFDEGSFASEAARCMHQLGKLPQAQRHAERILELRPAGHTRSRALGQLMLATVLIEQDQPEPACIVAQDVLDATPWLSSYQVIEQLRGLRRLLAPHRANTVVKDFLECLGEVLHQRVWLDQWPAK
ncbi:MAG: helix-turn-helix domain-containing protein [Pseudonocardiaceae bacterium]